MTLKVRMLESEKEELLSQFKARIAEFQLKISCMESSEKSNVVESSRIQSHTESTLHSHTESMRLQSESMKQQSESLRSQHESTVKQLNLTHSEALASIRSEHQEQIRKFESEISSLQETLRQKEGYFLQYKNKVE